MVDGDIAPRSVDAMDKFKQYSQEASQNMKNLQQQMDKFTNSMAMTKTHTTDLRESLRQMGAAKPFQQMEESIKEVQSGLEKSMKSPQMTQRSMSERRPIGGTQAPEEQSNVTVNLRIDVSGVTDKSDKRQLAKEISTMVMKEMRSKMGGPLNTSGFNRSG